MVYKVAIIGTGAGYTGEKVPPAPIAAIAEPAFVPELVEPRLRSRSRTPFDRGMTALGYLDCAIEAEKNGYDAVFINTFGDYGIDEMKSALSIPVVGAGEATMSLACNLGRRFSIVTIWPPSRNHIYHERLRNCGMEQRCVSVRNVLSNAEAAGLSDGDEAVIQMRAGDSTILTRIIESVDNAIRQDGADTVLLGCTCMAPIGPVVADQCPVPVLEAMRTGYKITETLLYLGARHSNIAYPKPQSANLAAISGLIDGSSGIDMENNCEICVVANNKTN